MAGSLVHQQVDQSARDSNAYETLCDVAYPSINMRQTRKCLGQRREDFGSCLPDFRAMLLRLSLPTLIVSHGNYISQNLKNRHNHLTGNICVSSRH